MVNKIYELRHLSINGNVGHGFWRFYIVAPDQPSARLVAFNYTSFDTSGPIHVDIGGDSAWVDCNKSVCSEVGVATGQFSNGICILALEYKE